MENYIEIEELTKKAEAAGVELGKGDPYNRLRYFTKIGWLPHMIRKKTEQGVVGHYPSWVLNRLILIDKLKKQGLDNDEITSKLNTQNKVNSLYAKVSSPEFKNKIVMYAIFAIVTIILLNESEIITLSKSKNELIKATLSSEIKNQVVDSGDAFITANNNKVFVKTSKLTGTNRVNITFKDNYAPATRFWISEIKPQEGFYLELDAPVTNTADFGWIITQ